MFQPRTGRTPMIIDAVHNAVSSTQACLALTLRPGGETIARYLKVMKWKTHFFDENRCTWYQCKLYLPSIEALNDDEIVTNIFILFFFNYDYERIWFSTEAKDRAPLSQAFLFSRTRFPALGVGYLHLLVALI